MGKNSLQNTTVKIDAIDAVANFIDIILTNLVFLNFAVREHRNDSN